MIAMGVGLVQPGSIYRILRYTKPLFVICASATSWIIKGTIYLLAKNAYNALTFTYLQQFYSLTDDSHPSYYSPINTWARTTP